MEYNFSNIEKKWQEHWTKSGAYAVKNDSPRPKFYVLDMFPYPSGAGLHVGHPLGYIASDIFARYKRLKGFNVLHTMGYDAFGLPAEQYAIEHGIHPAVSTADNISNFRSQLDKIGFCFDWTREVNTSKPEYYKWTQWIFLQLFDSWYNRISNKAERIDVLQEIFGKEGNARHECPGDNSIKFTSAEWKSFDEKKRMDILMNYRLSYCGYGEVNWCEGLGTVLANDEVINGVSERGGFPVEKKRLRQWYLRITEYAERLLEGLNKVDFSDAMKEMQTNWIGKSYGAEIDFVISNLKSSMLRVYTTRPDTIFGVDFMVLAPEHDLIQQITTPAQKAAVEEYISYVNSRSERERMAEKKITGVFTGAFAINPFNQREIPIWISEYVLAGYGTGAIMGVPCGDERDHKFAKYFGIPITNIIGSHYNGEEANPTKEAILENSDFLNGMIMSDAIGTVIKKVEGSGIGIRKVNYKMRDAAFSRQRYWGEPFPIIWKDGIAYPMREDELPVVLPHMDELKPGPNAEGPLSNLSEWKHYQGGIREVNTMPGYAGSSWYFLRYMDPHNEKEFCSRKASDYWGQVDIYIGGTEHAVGHLLYSRMWTKALYDLGYVGHDEPYRKLVNQGMIQGVSQLIYRYNGFEVDHVQVEETKAPAGPGLLQFKEKITELKFDKSQTFYFAADNVEEDQAGNFTPLHVPVQFVENSELDVDGLRNYWGNERDGIYVTNEGFYEAGVWKNWDLQNIQPPPFKTKSQVEKMSKRYFNVVNPDDVVAKYGADTYRMYEMFLGPVELGKPWDTKGIEGVHRFLKKLWRLFYDEQKGKVWNEEKANDAELKVLHKAIKKIEEDTGRFSFNTGVSAFMICVNELSDLKCNKIEVLEKLLILLTPYAPHICEELWSLTGHSSSILDASYPEVNNKYLIESSRIYPVSVNGRVRAQMDISLEASQQEVEQMVLNNEVVQKWLEGKPHKKIIYVKGKMVNVVV